MSKDKELEDLLSDMHLALAAELVARIRNGEAKPADLNVARQFLKDNGIESLPKTGSPLGKLIDALPFPTTAEDLHPN